MGKKNLRQHITHEGFTTTIYVQNLSFLDVKILTSHNFFAIWPIWPIFMRDMAEM